MHPLSHLSSIKRKGFWSWEELGCLSRALGFPRDLFWRNLADNNRRGHGLESKEIKAMIESKHLNSDLDRTFNMHDAAYNIKAILFSIETIAAKTVNFTDLHLARVAFQFYEHYDSAGMLLDEHVILRAIKLCGRTAAPTKIMQHARHIDRLVQDRLMLYEFLEILPLTVKETDVADTAVNPNGEKLISDEDQKLYKLCDFESLLRTKDERRWNALDKQYQDTIAKVPVKKSIDRINVDHNQMGWYVPPLVNRQSWNQKVRWSKLQNRLLDNYLEQSNTTVKESCCSSLCLCERSISAQPQLESMDKKMGLKTNSERQSRPISHHGAGSDVLQLGARPALITAKDLKETELKLEEVKWNIETQSERASRATELRDAEYYKRFQKNIKQREQHRKQIALLSANSHATVSTQKSYKLRDIKDTNIHRVLMTRLNEKQSLIRIPSAEDRPSISAMSHNLTRLDNTGLLSSGSKDEEFIGSTSKFPRLASQVDQISAEVERSCQRMTER